MGRLLLLEFWMDGQTAFAIPLEGSSTQLALYQELAGPEGSFAAVDGACTHPQSCAMVDHCGQDRMSVRLILLQLTCSPSGDGTLQSHTDWV